jgi:hypothetical protein
MVRLALYLSLSFSATFFIGCGTAQEQATENTANRYNQNGQFGNQFSYAGFDNQGSTLINPTDGSTLMTGDALQALQGSIQQNPLTQQDRMWTPQSEAPSGPSLLDGVIERFQNRDPNSGGLFSRLRDRFSR